MKMTRTRKDEKKTYKSLISTSFPTPSESPRPSRRTMHSDPLLHLLPLGQDHRVPQIPTPQGLFGVFPELILFGPLGQGLMGWRGAGFEGCVGVGSGAD